MLCTLSIEQFWLYSNYLCKKCVGTTWPMTTSLISEKSARSQLLETTHPSRCDEGFPRYTAQETWQTTKNGKIAKILTTCHRQDELHSTFLFKSAWLLQVWQSWFIHKINPPKLYFSNPGTPSQLIQYFKSYDEFYEKCACFRARFTCISVLADDGILSIWHNTCLKVRKNTKFRFITVNW